MRRSTPSQDQLLSSCWNSCSKSAATMGACAKAATTMARQVVNSKRTCSKATAQKLIPWRSEMRLNEHVSDHGRNTKELVDHGGQGGSGSSRGPEPCIHFFEVKRTTRHGINDEETDRHGEKKPCLDSIAWKGNAREEGKPSRFNRTRLRYQSRMCSIIPSCTAVTKERSNSRS